MITLLGVAAWQLTNTPVLVACIIGVGVSTGFYIVPLFTLLQHRAPKTSKGEMIATSNFVNVVGAITATLLFRGVVLLAHASRFAPEQTAREELGVRSTGQPVGRQAGGVPARAGGVLPGGTG